MNDNVQIALIGLAFLVAAVLVARWAQRAMQPPPAPTPAEVQASQLLAARHGLLAAYEERDELQADLAAADAIIAMHELRILRLAP